MRNILIFCWILGVANGDYANFTLNGPNVCNLTEILTNQVSENVHDSNNGMLTINKTVTKVYVNTKCCTGYIRNGTNCISQCKQTCNFGVCYEPNKCACNSGFNGSSCNTINNSSCYKLLNDNEKCTLDCQCRHGGRCNKNDGKCVCDTGWNGTICITRICPENKFGINCDNNCECKETETCNAVSGVCRAYPKVHDSVVYYSKCSKVIRCYKTNTECDVNSGKCICTPGWTGDICSEKCPHLRYGRDCKLKCLDYSNNKTFVKQCDHKTGKNICNPGYTGEKCDKICHKNRYGNDCSNSCKCKSFMECSPFNGFCSCPEGFTGKNCRTECSDGYFGFNCSKTCECNGNTNCRKYDGYCICKPGWIGENCDKICPEGFYGAQCNQPCDCTTPNSICHFELGCIDKKSLTDSWMSMIITTLPIIVSTVIALAIIFCIYKILITITQAKFNNLEYSNNICKSNPSPTESTENENLNINDINLRRFTLNSNLNLPLRPETTRISNFYEEIISDSQSNSRMLYDRLDFNQPNTPPRPGYHCVQNNK